MIGHVGLLADGLLRDTLMLDIHRFAPACCTGPFRIHFKRLAVQREHPLFAQHVTQKCVTLLRVGDARPRRILWALRARTASFILHFLSYYIHYIVLLYHIS